VGEWGEWAVPHRLGRCEAVAALIAHVQTIAFLWPCLAWRRTGRAALPETRAQVLWV